jgi:hypothetical protein
MNDSVQQSCGTCKFFKRNVQDVNTGYCRVAHAQVLIAPVKTPQGIQPHPVAVFPNMDHNDWCGEWKGKVLQ